MNGWHAFGVVLVLGPLVFVVFVMAQDVGWRAVAGVVGFSLAMTAVIATGALFIGGVLP